MKIRTFRIGDRKPDASEWNEIVRRTLWTAPRNIITLALAAGAWIFLAYSYVIQ